jgi:enoyl-CoA hydratase/carnithine racemase
MSTVLYDKRGEVAYVTLNRPEAMNAIDFETHRLLQQIWTDFRDDDELRVAIVTGAGDEAFCAGADLKTHVPQWLGVPGMHEMGARAKVRDGLGGLTRGLHRIYKPIVAAVNGWALAGGFETALACDIRIASENAKFGSFEIRRGFHHADGGIVRLVNICGAGFAAEMLLTGEPVDADRALTANLVSKRVAHDELMDAAEATVASILRNDQTALESAKETLLDVIGRPLDDQLALEALYGYTLMGNPTIPGRLAHFYDKTDPGRTGKNAAAVNTADVERN